MSYLRVVKKCQASHGRQNKIGNKIMDANQNKMGNKINLTFVE